MPPHAAAQALILLRQGAGAESRLAVMHHDEIRIGAHHRQPAGERGVHDRRVGLDRLIPFGRACVQDEVRLGRRVDKREVQPLADFEVALGTDMQAAVPERGIERLAPMLEMQPCFFA